MLVYGFWHLWLALVLVLLLGLTPVALCLHLHLNYGCIVASLLNMLDALIHAPQ